MQIILTSDQSKSFDLNQQIVKLNPQQRFQRAIKKFGLFLGLAIFCIFIPVFHFILVPLFLLIAIISGWKTYTVEFELDLESQKCLQCQQNLNPVYYLGPDLRFRCEHCHSHYVVKQA